MRRFLLLIITTLLFASAYATNATETLTGLSESDVQISGTVVDRVTRAKMNGVSITIPNSNISTVTNADGFFLLKLKECPERIVVSYIGYKKQSVAIQRGKATELHISMVPATITLPALNVWQNDPEALVNSAIDLVYENFVQTRELHTSFYRETLQKGGRFIDISEAILSTCKKGYSKGIMFDRVKVEQGRHIVSQRTKDTISVKVQGGPMTAINYDVVKNQDILFADIKDKCYSFSMEVPEELDGRTQIVISFRPRTIRDWPLYSGKIYLDRQTLAFTRIEMSLDVTDQVKTTRMLLVKKPNGLRFRALELATIINYHDGRINYMHTSFRFKCDWKRRLFSRTYTSCSEMVVTDFQPNYEGPNIELKERLADRDILINTIDNYYDSDFWKDYNIIEPTENLEKAILKLKKSDRQ